jgi:type I restriction enzyme S subunit
VPSLEEQKKIVAILDQVFTAIDQAKVNIEKNIVNAKELFQSKREDFFIKAYEISGKRLHYKNR